MKITAVETIGLPEFPNLLWVQVHTDEGFTGLGETFFGSQAVAAWIHESAAPVLLGQDALAIERHWQALVGFIGGTGTGAENRGRSAIDIALWDILGQASGQPLYQLWGGAVRERIPVYNTCAGPDYTRQRPHHAHLPVENWGMGSHGGRYEDLEAFLHHADELAGSLVEEGYFGMKIWPLDLYADQFGGHALPGSSLKQALEPFEKIRRAVGDDIEILVEMHAKWDLPAAKAIAKALEAYRPYWFEDPIAARSCAALADFAQSTWVATAASETLGTRWGYRDLLDHNAVGVVIFDPTWTGGASEARRIAAIAETYERPVAAHDCVGPVALAVDSHLAMHVPNVALQEVVRAYYFGWYQDLVTTLPRLQQGYLYPLTAPGLGLQLQPDVLNRVDCDRRVSRQELHP